MYNKNEKECGFLSMNNKSIFPYTKRIPNHKLEDIILTKFLREEINKFLEEQLQSNLLRSYGVKPRNKLLLTGPSGVGKSSVAEVIAEKISVPIFNVNCIEMINICLEETTHSLEHIFDFFTQKNCILFLDEFEEVSIEKNNVVVHYILKQLVKIPSYTLVIASTCYPKHLHKTALQCFQLRLNFPLPKIKELVQFLNKFEQDLMLVLGETPSSLANKLGQISYADAKQFCLDVRRRAILTK